MIKVVQLGIAQLRGSEDLAQSDDEQTPAPPSRRFANSRN